MDELHGWDHTPQTSVKALGKTGAETISGLID